MKRRVAYWRHGFPAKVDPDSALSALEGIEAEHGGLTAELVVDAARPDDHPLHPQFEWDDSVAAEEYRKGQARVMIRSIKVYEDSPRGRQNEMHRFSLVNRQSGGEDGPVRVYLPTDEALQDPELRQQLLDRALKEVERWRDRWGDLTELANIFVAIEDTSVPPKEEAA